MEKKLHLTPMMTAHTEDLSSEQLMMIKEQHSAISKPAKNKRFKQSYGLNFAC
jgi:hypothetical protein